MNFSFLSFGTYLDLIFEFPVSRKIYSERFFDAGFDTHSFLLHTADVLFMFTVTTLTVFIKITILKVVCRSGIWLKRLSNSI